MTEVIPQSDAPAPLQGNDSFSVVEHDGWEVLSNTQTEEQIRKDIGAPSEVEEVAEAASTLGKKGAEARKAKPIPPKKEAKPEAKAEEKPEEKAAADEDAEADETPEAKPEAKESDAERIAKKKRDARERVLEATREAAELKRENRRLAEELAARKAQEARPAPKAEAKAADPDDPEPEPQEGEDEVAFLEKKSRWWARQEFKRLDQARVQTERSRDFERHINERSKVVESAIEKAGGKEFLDGMSDDVLLLEPSFFVLARGEKPTALNALADEVLRAGDGSVRLMRYLTEHPEVFQRLSSPTLRPADFAREMGRIEARMEAATSGPPATKPSSQAPRPARPVAGLPTIADGPPPDEADYDAHVAYYNAKEGKGRRRTA